MIQCCENLQTQQTFNCNSAATVAAPKTQPAENRLRLSQGEAVIYRNATDVPPELWNRGFGDTPKNLRYYELLEQTMGADFDYRYVAVFSEANQPLALQPVVLAKQDLL